MPEISVTGQPGTFADLGLGTWFVPIPATPALSVEALPLYKKVSEQTAIRIMPNTEFGPVPFNRDLHVWYLV